MSLNDLIFDGIFPGDGGRCDGDGTPSRPHKCSWRNEECEDEGKDFCRSCLGAGESGIVQSVGEQLVAAARALGTMSTPTAVAVPLQTAAGTLSPHIPMVNADSVASAPSNATAPLSGGREQLIDAQATRKKATDRESQRA